MVGGGRELPGEGVRNCGVWRWGGGLSRSIETLKGTKSKYVGHDGSTFFKLKEQKKCVPKV